MKSKDVQNKPGDPRLRRTGGVLHCCLCSPGRKELVRRAPGGEREKSRFSAQRGPEKQDFFTGSGKVEDELFPLADDNNTCSAFSSPSLGAFRPTEAGHNNELMIFYCEVLMLFVPSPLSQLNDCPLPPPSLPSTPHSSDLRISPRCSSNSGEIASPYSRFRSFYLPTGLSCLR